MRPHFGRLAGRDLGREITAGKLRDPHVREQDVSDRLDNDVVARKTHHGQAQTFLIGVARIRRPAAGILATDIEMVGFRSPQHDEFTFPEYRRHDIDVVLVCAAAGIGIIRDKHISRLHVARRIACEHRVNDEIHAAIENGDPFRLRDEPAVTVEQHAAVIVDLADNGGEDVRLIVIDISWTMDMSPARTTSSVTASILGELRLDVFSTLASASRIPVSSRDNAIVPIKSRRNRVGYCRGCRAGCGFRSTSP